MPAESGALSTGEAIGTVSRNPIDGYSELGRGVSSTFSKKISFHVASLLLDEAARLIPKSISRCLNCVTV
ncbi:hypothetical protein O9992_02365 [Vibrio lentus]|nr:hypothetical protein [Vibrio lentus]